ncbi:ABC transporter permease [Rathayibacter tanaceti]|uniref:ABC transporter permease n=1 Tax=Rathayibacter tanaceti TaxID=1671680 RepID=A0AAE6RIH8_9MICO|nr:ABC transporter permease [Rathayibacter tanaceti]QHC55452.1 ABC transporter permease [Rathayibacter tanaceti]
MTRSLRAIIVSLAVGPCLQIVYLVGMSGATGGASVRVAIAALLLAGAVVAVESTAVTLATSRRDGVLSAVVLSTLPAALVWLGHVLAATGVGIVSGCAGLVLASILFGPTADFPLVLSLLAVIVVSLASAGFGFAVAALSLRLRDALLRASIVVSLMILLGGVVAPISSYDAVARIPAYMFPLTSSVQAVDEFLVGHADRSLGLLCLSALTGAIWAVVGGVAWTWALRSSRTTGQLDLS